MANKNNTQPHHLDYAAEEWSRLTERDPDSLAVVEPERTITCAQLVHQSRLRAGQFIAQGVTPGSRVIIARPNVIEFVVDYLAVRLCGAILVNLPWSAGTSITELAEVLDAQVVVITEHLVGENTLFDQLGDRRFREHETAPIGPTEPIPLSADKVAWLACTSGTTGTPKAAMHTGASWERQTQVFAEHFELTENDPVLVTSPVGHAVSLLFGVRMCLMLNSIMVLIPRWKIEVAADLIDRYQCVFTVAPTPYLIDAVTYAEKHGTEQFKSLRFFPSAGAPVPRSLVRRGLDALPNCQVWSYFGTSEAGAVTAVPLDADLERRLNTDGISMPGTQTRVVNGELQLHNPQQMMLGYWSGDPDQRLHADGWYETGDACDQREDGYIKMIGRARDIILRGGENISPLEIENVLLGHDQVTDVCIVGYPDERLGSRLAAVVVATKDTTLDTLRWHCQSIGLDKAKWPEMITHIEAIPLSPIGKVKRGDLEDLVWNIIKKQGASGAQ
jgi:cyclohexanecarboxylate-CoA ligase